MVLIYLEGLKTSIACLALGVGRLSWEDFHCSVIPDESKVIS